MESSRDMQRVRTDDKTDSKSNWRVVSRQRQRKTFINFIRIPALKRLFLLWIDYANTRWKAPLQMERVRAGGVSEWVSENEWMKWMKYCRSRRLGLESRANFKTNCIRKLSGSILVNPHINQTERQEYTHGRLNSTHELPNTRRMKEIIRENKCKEQPCKINDLFSL